MSFFDDLEPPTPEPEHVEYRPPAWASAPEHVIPGAVGLDVVLARTPEVAVWLGDLGATPDGVRFTLNVLRREMPADAGREGPLWGAPRPGAVRFGVAFADGRKIAYEAHGRPRGSEASGDAASEIALVSGSGSGSPRRSSRGHWLWPLPPEGPVTFALSWLDEGIEETVVEIDGAPIRAAAARAVELWEDPRPLLPEDPAERRGGWGAYT
ncbi:MAG: hypothetical protein JWR63_2708 [Conexibacter sp.]|nr:hypothetical protein [Conexibacter sp.]